jgi:hypothetical protein
MSVSVAPATIAADYPPRRLERSLTVAMRWWHVLALVCLLVAAFGLRLYHVQDPPLGFHATRQYRSLLLARSYYFDSQASIPAWEREVADTSAARQGILEPPLLEHIVALGYQITGGESLWPSKVLSSFFWLVGGVCLYRLAQRLAGSGPAVLSTALYLFLPFGVVASRSFQPDPLMVMLVLGSWLAIVRYWETNTRWRFAVMAGLSASAFFVKPTALFPLLGPFLALSITARGARATLWSRQTALYVAVTLLPTLGVYAYGVVTGTFLVTEAEKTVLPELFVTTFFWRSWLANINVVLGIPILLAALAGTCLLRDRRSRALVGGVWAGYVLFCLAVNYNVATHDYYQLQLIPIVALGLAPLARLGLAIISTARLVLRVAAWSAVSLVLVTAVLKGAAHLDTPALVDEPANARDIGALVQHSTRTIFLSGDYGVPLEYHGLLSGSAWPIASDLEWDRLAGVPVPTAEERFQTRFANGSPEYFIVTDIQEFENQPDLQQLLGRSSRLLVRTPEYLVFDLRPFADAPRMLK